MALSLLHLLSKALLLIQQQLRNHPGLWKHLFTHQPRQNITLVCSSSSEHQTLTLQSHFQSSGVSDVLPPGGENTEQHR